MKKENTFQFAYLCLLSVTNAVDNQIYSGMQYRYELLLYTLETELKLHNKPKIGTNLAVVY